MPLFFRLLEEMQEACKHHRPSQVQGKIQDTVATAFVDPSDPSKIFLTQPHSDDDRIPTAPAYATNYGQDEVYEDIPNSERQ